MEQPEAEGNNPWVPDGKACFPSFYPYYFRSEKQYGQSNGGVERQQRHLCVAKRSHTEGNGVGNGKGRYGLYQHQRIFDDEQKCEDKEQMIDSVENMNKPKTEIFHHRAYPRPVPPKFNYRFGRTDNC